VDVIKTIYNISQHARLRDKAVRQGGTVPLVRLAPFAHKAGQQATACALCNLSKVQDTQCRGQMVNDGAIPVLSTLSSNENSVTQKMCTIALANLSAFARVQGGAVSSLLKVAFKDDANASMFLPEEPTEELKSGQSSPVVPKSVSRKASKAKHVLQAYIHTGVFFNAAEKRAPGVFHNSYTKNLRHIIDLPPPVDLQSAESSTGFRRQSYYGDSIFEAAVTRSLKYPRIAAGGACIENRPFMEPSEREPVFHLQKQSLQAMDEDDDGTESKEESGKFISLPLPRLEHIPNMHALTDARDSSLNLIKEEKDKEDEESEGNEDADSTASINSTNLKSLKNAAKGFRRSLSHQDTARQKTDLFPKIVLKIHGSGKRKGERSKEKDEKELPTSLPKVKSMHRMNNMRQGGRNNTRENNNWRRQSQKQNRSPGTRTPLNGNAYSEKKFI